MLSRTRVPFGHKQLPLIRADFLGVVAFGYTVTAAGTDPCSETYGGDAVCLPGALAAPGEGGVDQGQKTGEQDGCQGQHRGPADGVQNFG